MEKRHTIVEKYSTFYQVSPVCCWITDLKLKRNITPKIEQHPTQNDKFWVKHWLEAAINKSDPLAVQHIRAYLEETCFWSAKVTYQRFTCLDFTWLDYWQIARVEASDPVKLFKKYDPLRSNPAYYAQLKISSAILDVVRKDREAERCSDWGLLLRSSKRALKTALEKSGIKEPQLSRYLLAWQGFQEIYTALRVRGNRCEAPTPEQLADIADYYNQFRFPQSTEPQQSGSDILALLEMCSSALRVSTKIAISSLDASPAIPIDYNSVEQELVTAEFQEELQQLQEVLQEAIATLPPDARKMLILEHGFPGLNQTQIAKEFGIKQYQVSRQLDKHKCLLLKALAQWSKNHASLTHVEAIDELSKKLDEWLDWYSQTTILYKFLQTTLSLHPTLKQEIPLLTRHFGAETSTKALANELKLKETELNEKLSGIRQILQEELLGWMQKTFKLTPNSLNAVAKPSALLVDSFLLNAPYAHLK